MNEPRILLGNQVPILEQDIIRVYNPLLNELLGLGSTPLPIYAEVTDVDMAPFPRRGKKPDLEPRIFIRGLNPPLKPIEGVIYPINMASSITRIEVSAVCCPRCWQKSKPNELRGILTDQGAFHRLCIKCDYTRRVSK